MKVKSTYIYIINLNISIDDEPKLNKSEGQHCQKVFDFKGLQLFHFLKD